MNFNVEQCTRVHCTRVGVKLFCIITIKFLISSVGAPLLTSRLTVAPLNIYTRVSMRISRHFLSVSRTNVRA